MGKLRKSDRVAVMCKELYGHPNVLFSLGYFAETFDVAKSTVSEDILMMKEIVEQFKAGEIETFPGVAGGVKYLPKVTPSQAYSIVQEMCRRLSSPERIIPGGYLYMADLIFNPEVIADLGRIFATRFLRLEPDYVITVETKGIPLALFTAYNLGVPLVTVRRDTRVTEGSVVSINYTSGTTGKIQTMSLAKRALPQGARVVVVDDFMRAGGSVRGIIDLLSEFSAEVLGTGVLAETAHPAKKLVDDYFSLLVLEEVDGLEKKIHIRPSNWLEGGKNNE